MQGAVGAADSREHSFRCMDYFGIVLLTRLQTRLMYFEDFHLVCKHSSAGHRKLHGKVSGWLTVQWSLSWAVLEGGGAGGS